MWPLVFVKFVKLFKDRLCESDAESCKQLLIKEHLKRIYVMIIKIDKYFFLSFQLNR